MRKKTLIIAVGGTGGHLYPAMGLARRLSQLESSLVIHFVGGGLAGNKHFEGGAYSHKEVSCGTLSLRKPFSAPSSLAQIVKGVRQSYRFIRECRPSLVVGFGSNHSLPALAAAKLAGIPIVLHEQNSVPGRVNRLLSRYAVCTGVYFPSAMRRLKGECLEVGMPLREGYRYGTLSKEEAKFQLGLDPAKPVILVFGGSQGARRINQLFLGVIEGKVFKNLQFLHLTGNSELVTVLQENYRAYGVQALVKDYEARMDIAWSAADLVVSRAGAGSIAEQIEFEVPGILIPYPFAMDNHQESNVDFMVEQIGGAIKLREKNLDSKQLIRRIGDIVAGRKLPVMRLQIKDYKLRHTARDFSALIKDML